MARSAAASYRRPNGYGSYWYSRSEGRFRARYRDAQGTVRTLSARSHAEILDKLSQAMALAQRRIWNCDSGQGSIGRDYTISDFAETWLKSRSDLAPRTAQRYKLDIEREISPRLGKHLVSDLSVADCSQFVSHLQESGKSTASIRHAVAVLRSMLSEAVRLDIRSDNPAKLIGSRSQQKRSINYLGHSETLQVLSVAKDRGVDSLARWSLALILGLRQGECLGLRWDDVNHHEQILNIRWNLQYLPGQGLILTRPKSNAGIREVPVSAGLNATLDQLRQETLHAAPQDFIFGTRDGKPRHPRNDHRNWKKLLLDANLPQVRLHDCRHSAATNMLHSGVPVHYVSRILGHSSPSVTLNMYSHVRLSSMRDAVGIWDSKFI